MICTEVRGLLFEGSIGTVGTYGFQVDVSISDKGKVKPVFAKFRANTGGKPLAEYLKGNPLDKNGKPMLFVLKSPVQIIGITMEKLDYAYTAEGLLALAGKLSKIDFLSHAENEVREEEKTA